MNQFYILVLFILSSTAQNIKYELENKRQHTDTVITAAPETFKITIQDQLPVLKKGMLNIITGLESLAMDNVSLTDIEPGAFDNQNITEFISLSFNNLTVIRSFTFRNLPTKYLYIDFNQISYVEKGAIMEMPNLQMVSISNNKLKNLNPRMIVDTPDLTTVSFYNNGLRTLGRDNFRFMAKEKDVYIMLENNQISKVAAEAFTGLKIGYLGLGNNLLEDLSEKAFVGSTVGYLDLSSNKLKTKPTINASQVFLSGNPCSEGDAADLQFHGY